MSASNGAAEVGAQLGRLIRRAAEDLVHSLWGGAAHLLRMLTSTDEPEHPKCPRVVQEWFMQPLEHRIRIIARSAVDGMASHTNGWDVAPEVAHHHPLRVVTKGLGVSAQDEAFVLTAPLKCTERQTGAFLNKRPPHEWL
ncbi:hypothetical protein [Bradyrhizobium sp. Ai1a-2]|uniref:hypothetical protein n=1 Tax=Bradyrhizobium sp. Ai1a-2 TaxID=196490 RepID=UPI000487362A|nr:hypothetical protein [Bradyrhizobium sp. Ai1a-2]